MLKQQSKDKALGTTQQITKPIRRHSNDNKRHDIHPITRHNKDKAQDDIVAIAYFWQQPPPLPPYVQSWLARARSCSVVRELNMAVD